MRKISLFLISLAFIFYSAASFAAKDVEQAYIDAKACYGEVKVTPSKMKSPGEWEQCIRKFENISEKYPKTERATQSLFNAGKLSQEMYGKFKKAEDAEAAIKYYNQLIREYPKSSLADDALFQIGKLRVKPLKQNDRARTAFEYIVENYPNGDMTDSAKSELTAMDESAAATGAVAEDKPRSEEGGDTEQAAKPAAPPGTETPKVREDKKNVFAMPQAGPGNPATLISIDVDKKDESTVVFLNLSRRATYSLDFQDSGTRIKAPPKLDVLLAYTRMGDSLAKEFSVASPYLTKIRVKKGYLEGGVRLVFELAPQATYNISAKGERIVIKFARHGKSAGEDAPEPQANLGKNSARKGKTKPLTVVIDPGHGGSDTGAIGPGGTKEKDITLALAKRVAAELKEKTNAKVILTRTDDSTLTLEERNAVAVKKKADLFISVHVNASTNRKMTGIETYYLNNATDEAAAKLAKRENRSAGKKLSDVEHILSTMLQNYDAAESQLLAADVQNTLVSRVSKKYDGVKNRKVRSALFYVLVGAKCPAILVETSFISNPKEEKRLLDNKYKMDIAKGIADGVNKYIVVSDRRSPSL